MDKQSVIKNLRSVHNNLPIGIIATALGAMTISNVYLENGFPFLKDFISILAVIVLCLGILKVLLYPRTIAEEFKLPIVASLYPTASMLLMVLGNHFTKIHYGLGKGIWISGIILYVCLMILITYNHVIRNFNYELLTPAFFVPYVGILVACVASGGMNEEFLVKTIFFFGTTMYIILLPIILVRVITKPIAEKFFPTIAILVAPPSLVVTSYIILFPNPKLHLITLLLFIVLVFLLYVYTQIPRIVSKPFHAGFASLTFPTAISCFATYKISIYFKEVHEDVSQVIRAIVSIELVISTTIITFVIYSLFVLLFKRLSAQDTIE